MSNPVPIRFETGRPMLLAGLRQRHAFAAAEPGIARQWQTFLSRAAIPGRTGSSLYGVMCGADATSMEYMCGVQVESLSGLPERVGRMRVPAQHYAVFAHPGPASALRTTWQLALAWLSSGSYESAHAPDFELYRPGVDPLAAHAGIELWVGVVARKRADAEPQYRGQGRVQGEHLP